MSISTKTALPILAMAILLSLSAFLIQRHLILPAFSDIETQQAQDHIDRVIRRLEAELRTVDFTVYDWSSWDDTYRFAADQNEGFVRSNLNADTFENYGFEVALLMDLEGTPLWAGVYDFQAEEGNVDQTGQYLAGLLAKANELSQRIDLTADVDDQRARGTLDLQGTPVLFSMRPIHRSDGSGDPRGFVLFGQALSAQFVAALSEEIVMDFSLEELNEHPSETSASGALSPYWIEAISTERLRVSRALNVDGQAQLAASAVVPRNITRLGSDITVYSISVFVALSLLLSAMLLVLFRMLVVRPILTLKQDISSISDAMDYSLRAHIRNEDEIGALSMEFNRMLSVIETNNDALKKLTETDPLTGLYNRLALDKKLRQAWDILSRTGDPLSLMLVDIDHFKAYNDNYGHQAGDECLQRIAAILQTGAKRDADMVARYGGEEFLIVLPGTPIEDARVIAEELHQSVIAAGLSHEWSGVAPCVTISIGLSSVAPSGAENVRVLINAADRALYRAKGAGRNRVECEPIHTDTSM